MLVLAKAYIDRPAGYILTSHTGLPASRKVFLEGSSKVVTLTTPAEAT